MTAEKQKMIELKVNFAGLEPGEQAPRFAAYQLDSAGRPVRRIGSYDGQVLRFADTDTVAFGPDVEDFSTLPKESLVSYRVAQKIELWRRQGLVLARDVWQRFLFQFVCVSGTVRKCRPWFWDFLDDIRVAPALALVQEARIKPITADLLPHIWFPLRCQPLCDGIVEVYERECCCFHFPVPDLLDRLRGILDILPIPLPDPIPLPRPDPAPFMPVRTGQLAISAAELRNRARVIQRRTEPLDLSALPSQELYQDYLALRELPLDAARQYVLERPYLFPLFCRCSVRMVGQTPIQPGGHFDFCYLRVPHHGRCFRTYAYRVKQLINGVLTVVYDGLAAHQYFGAGSPATISSYNPRARTCADGPGDPPPNDGAAFVMLEYVGDPDTNHFNFPDQNGASRTQALAPDSGTYTTSYAPDCPWGGALGLHLWFSPELSASVQYYRLKAIAVDDAGNAVGTPVVLNDSVTWDKLVTLPGGDIVRAPETLGPLTVGSENDLFRVPYWSSPDHRYLTGQFHQVWDTARSSFPDGKYLLVLEVFDGSGARIQPNGASGPYPVQNFQFRRWKTIADTDPVPYADVVQVFWIDNTPVGGDLVDLRKDGLANTAECQYTTGTAASTFAIGFRAYHVHGVQQAGNGDDNSFMYYYRIGWQRGLNGASGTLGPAPGFTSHTDVGETGGAVSSGSETFQTMLTRVLPDGTSVVLSKCTFSVRLNVYAKHFNGYSRISQYDYTESASFALEIA